MPKSGEAWTTQSWVINERATEIGEAGVQAAKPNKITKRTRTNTIFRFTFLNSKIVFIFSRKLCTSGKIASKIVTLLLSCETERKVRFQDCKHGYRVHQYSWGGDHVLDAEEGVGHFDAVGHSLENEVEVTADKFGSGI